MGLLVYRNFLVSFLLFNVVCLGSCSETDSLESASLEQNDPLIDPMVIKEDGCPIVGERHGLNYSELNGIWAMPFASLNWLADLAVSIHKKPPRMSEITSLCPVIQVEYDLINLRWDLKFVCPKLKGIVDMYCWSQTNSTKSKFLCWNQKEDREQYVMIAATNNKNWLVLIRCMPREANLPGEGMSWIILSRKKKLRSDISQVLFGILDGYGFDVEEFKTPLLYNNCIKKVPG